MENMVYFSTLYNLLQISDDGIHIVTPVKKNMGPIFAKKVPKDLKKN